MATSKNYGKKKGSDHFRDILNPYGEKSNYGKIGRRRRLSKLNVLFFSIILSVTIYIYIYCFFCSANPRTIVFFQSSFQVSAWAMPCQARMIPWRRVWITMAIQMVVLFEFVTIGTIGHLLSLSILLASFSSPSDFPLSDSPLWLSMAASPSSSTFLDPNYCCFDFPFFANLGYKPYYTIFPK